VNGVSVTSIPACRFRRRSVYSTAGIPQLSVSTNVKYTQQGYKTAFRPDGRNDGKQGKALGEYAVKTLKLKRVAVIDDATAYGQDSPTSSRKR
jgi:branched-chain amino acid transport system substrate-binding protein